MAANIGQRSYFRVPLECTSYGCLAVEGNTISVPHTAGLRQTWTIWGPTGLETQHGIEVNMGTAEIIIQQKGTYFLFLTAAVDVTMVNTVLMGQFVIDGVPSPILAGRDKNAGGMGIFSTLSASGYRHLVEGTVLTFDITTDATTDVVVQDANFGGFRMACSG